MMEGTLEAGVHYVELKQDATTGCNLKEQIQFCVDNDAECQEIAENGKRFMEHYRFCDEEYQHEIEAKVLNRYCEQTDIQLDYEEDEESMKRLLEAAEGFYVDTLWMAERPDAAL